MSPRSVRPDESIRTIRSFRMTERKRPYRGRRPRSQQISEDLGDPNPYLDAPDSGASSEAAPPPAAPSPRSRAAAPPPIDSAAAIRSAGDQLERIQRMEQADRAERAQRQERLERAEHRPVSDRPERPPRHRHERGPRPDRGERSDHGASDDRGIPRRNGRRGRSRFKQHRGGASSGGGGNEPAFERVPSVVTPEDGLVSGWFDTARDGGFLRQAANSYLPEPTDPFVPPGIVRDYQLRRGDKIDATFGSDQRGRHVVIDITALNDGPPEVTEKRPDFNTLTASYPDRKLTMETGKPAKTGPELTRRAIDLIAPIGYGQRALIVAPARAGKTTLLQAIVEGVSINHPEAALIVLLVDERPEEVSEMISWGYGEVVASSFDMPAKRHVEVADMALERSRRLVEMGKDVVIVLDSITRLARAHNTVDRGTGRTMSGGLDATAMQKPKAFFGSARMIAPEHGGGSLTIIATALVETGSRMDEVIFEEFKGTGNCEIKLDRSLAERRIYPAFDIATSGTRREEKLYRPDQLEKVHLLRRGLHQLPPQAGMEWLIKRIASTTNNDSLLDGL